MDLREGKEFFHGKCVIGGFDNRPESILVSGCQREIEEETKRLVDQAGKTGVIFRGRLHTAKRSRFK